MLSQKSNKSHKGIAEYEREISMLKAENDELRAKLDHMNEILLNMQRARFGQSSEKQKYVSPDQLSVFNEAEMEQDSKAPEPDEKTVIVPEHKRKPKGTLEDKIKELPSEDVFLDIPKDEKLCSACGKLLRREVEISNNFAENAIRPFVIGRKNWLFSDTVKRAKSSAIVYSLIETAKANGVEPYAYLTLVLTDMQYMGKPFSNEECKSRSHSTTCTEF